MNDKNIQVDLAVIQTDITYLKKHISIIEKKIDSAFITMQANYTPRNEFESVKSKVEILYNDKSKENRKTNERWYDIAKSIGLIVVALVIGWLVGGS